MIRDLIRLIYPEQCYSCGKNLYNNEQYICTKCMLSLPRTFDYKDTDNKLLRTFWGRISIETASSFLFFTKSGQAQHLIHKLKYSNKPEIGYFLGLLHGQELKESPCFKTVDLIIPVPLHQKRKKIRGYNQSEEIARGLSKQLGIPVNTEAFQRIKATETQTRKSRLERWENVKEVFHVCHPDDLEGKHLLLVDDVITTGSTMEGCIRKLLEVSNTKVSLACLAMPNG